MKSREQEEAEEIQAFNMMFGTSNESIEQIQRDFAHFRLNMWDKRDEDMLPEDLSVTMAIFQTRIALCLALHSIRG